MRYLIILLSTFYFLLSTVFAAAPDELKSSIEQKSKELENINKQIQENQQKLETVQGEKKTLQKEVSSVQNQIKQLNLGIKASEVNIEKLGLEIDSLQYNISDAEAQIVKKREAIAEILRQFQQKENESPLIAFLKNKTLSDGVFEAQSLADLGGNLNSEVNELNFFKDDLSVSLDKTTEKKQEREVENFTLKNKKSIADEIKKEKQVILEQTKNQEKIYQKQLSELEKQQQAISDEISELEDELRRTFDPSLLPSKRPGILAWPIKLVKDGGIGRITQHQGERSYLYRGKPHNGLDIGASIGTPVYAADDGIVEAADNNDKSYYRKYQYGKYVLIKHNNNMATLYAHLSKYVVARGTNVKRGELIGYSGNTGYSTGPHLHLGVYWAPSIQMKSIPPAAGLVPVGVIINPEDYL
ncbi:MAG: peptidoglycan DD-metalloendopeptidase family protein [Patescibacteria group bacterium]|nr:peptidoglycan DD-metalloendopeptidase family protein [Patescibacteria group bacterium]